MRRIYRAWGRAPRSERAIAVAAGLVAFGGWLALVLGGGEDLAVPIFGGAFLVLGFVAPLLCTLIGPDGIAAWTASARPQLRRRSRWPDKPRGLPSLGGPVVWLLPVALLPLMLLTVPLALVTEPGDWSILLVLAAFELLAAPGCLLCGLLVWFLVGLPMLLLGRAAARLVTGRASAADAFGSLLAALLLLVLLFAVTLVLGVDDQAGGRSGRLLAVLALIGLDERHVADETLLWVARTSGLLLAADVAALALLGKRLQRGRIENEPRPAPQQVDR